MGLILLILVGILPGSYSLNLGTHSGDIAAIVEASDRVDVIIAKRVSTAPSPEISADAALSEYLNTQGVPGPQTFSGFRTVNRRVRTTLGGVANLNALAAAERVNLRSEVYLVSETIARLIKTGQITDPIERFTLHDYESKIDRITRFIPDWVKFCVAVALGLGTMIGWKRIVVTVGEKIGKEHLTYAQGAAAELVAMTTIGAADIFGLPVSTTHVLSSGVAGTMAANGSGLQLATIRNLLMAWVLTLPAAICLSAGLYVLFSHLF